MTRTYYEILNDAGEPATARQRKAHGTSRYGYSLRLAAELACPDGATVYERHDDGGYDWQGRAVSMRLSDGHLMRLIP